MCDAATPDRPFTFITENTLRIRIWFDEMAHIEACNQYVLITLLNGKMHKTCMRFKWFHLNEKVQRYLVLVHKSHMVKPELVCEVQDKTLILLECGTEVPCFRKLFPELMQRIAETGGFTRLEDPPTQ